MNLAPGLQRNLRETPELERAFPGGGRIRDVLPCLTGGKERRREHS
jgi:hypothetical protein